MSSILFGHILVVILLQCHVHQLLFFLFVHYCKCQHYVVNTEHEGGKSVLCVDYILGHFWKFPFFFNITLSSGVNFLMHYGFF